MKFNKDLKKFIIYGLISIITLMVVIYVIYSNINFDKNISYEKIVEEENSKSDEVVMSELEDVGEHTLESIISFLDSYFNDMNKSKESLDVKEFSYRYLSNDFSSNIDIEGVLNTLKENHKDNVDYKYNYEIMYVKKDKVYDSYYIGVREWSEFTFSDGSMQKTDAYGGVYILDKKYNKFKISNIVDSDLSLVDKIEVPK